MEARSTRRWCILRRMPDPRVRRWRSSAPVQLGARELRRTLTPAERTLWQRLRRGQLAGYGFRRQYPVGRFIADFSCPAAKLVVEIDGDSHAQQADYDAERTRWLMEEKSYRVLRFTNEDVHRNLAGSAGCHRRGLAAASSLALPRSRRCSQGRGQEVCLPPPVSTSANGGGSGWRRTPRAAGGHSNACALTDRCLEYWTPSPRPCSGLLPGPPPLTEVFAGEGTREESASLLQ